MRVLHFNQFGSHVGGVEGYIADVSSALEQAGHSSFLVHFSSCGPEGLLSHMQYAPVPQWPDTAADAEQIIERIIHTFRPDIAYIHAVYHPALVEWIAKRLPSVAYVHGPYPLCPGSARFLRRSSRICPHATGLVCLLNAQTELCCWGRNPLRHVQLLRRVRSFMNAYAQVGIVLVGSRYMQCLLQYGGIPSDKSMILPPILFQEPLPQLTLSSESKTILFAGRLAPEKGLRSLVQAAAAIQSDWRLVVAGEGEENEPCQVLATQLGVADRIHSVGWLKPIEMEAQLEACACVAIPSLWAEPYCRLGPEAFLHGRPVVAFAVGGIPDWLEHGKSGYLVPPGDMAQFAGSLRQLLESPELRVQMGQYARQRAAITWDARTHVEQLLSAFRKVRAQGT